MADVKDHARNSVKVDDNDEEDVKESTVFVGNLDKDITEEILYAIFIDMGPIADVRIVPPKPGNMRTFGFVEFQDRSSALYSIAVLNNTALNGNRITLKIDGTSLLREWDLPEGYPIHLYPALSNFKGNKERQTNFNSSCSNYANVNSINLYAGHNYNTNNNYSTINQNNRNGYGYGVRFENQIGYRRDMHRNHDNNNRDQNLRYNRNDRDRDYDRGRDHGRDRARDSDLGRDRDRDRGRDVGRDSHLGRDRYHDHGRDRERGYADRRKRKYSSSSEDDQSNSLARLHAKRRRSRSKNRSRSRSRSRSDKHHNSSSSQQVSKNSNQSSSAVESSDVQKL